MKREKNYIYKLNILVMSVIAVIVFVVLVLIINHFIDILSFSNFELAILMPLVFIWIIIHELIHGIGYYLAGVSSSKIVYGAKLEKGIFYCLCLGKTSKKGTLFSLILPFLVIGVFTLIIGIIFSNNLLIYLSIFNISGCTGDFIMFYHFCKIKDFYFTELSDGVSFSISTSSSLEGKKLFGLKLVEVKDNLKNETTNIKKVSISKLSYIIFAIFISLSLFNIYLDKNSKNSDGVILSEVTEEFIINGKTCELSVSDLNGVTCECCSQEQMKIINDKYYDKNDISTSLTKIENYLMKNSN